MQQISYSVETLLDDDERIERDNLEEACWESEEALVEALNRFPESDRINFVAGCIYHSQKLLKKSEIHFRRAIRSNVEHWDAYRELGKVLIDQKQFGACHQLISRLKASPHVMETEPICIYLQAKMYLVEGDAEKAKDYIQYWIGYAWADEHVQEALRETNPRTNNRTQLWRVSYKGGLATLGIFVQMTEEHVAEFEVLANSEKEALSYAESYANLSDPSSKTLLTCERMGPCPEEETHRGVYHAYPFRLEEEKEDKRE